MNLAQITRGTDDMYTMNLTQITTRGMDESLTTIVYRTREKEKKIDRPQVKRRMVFNYNN